MCNEHVYNDHYLGLGCDRVQQSHTLKIISIFNILSKTDDPVPKLVTAPFDEFSAIEGA